MIPIASMLLWMMMHQQAGKKQGEITSRCLPDGSRGFYEMVCPDVDGPINLNVPAKPEHQQKTCDIYDPAQFCGKAGLVGQMADESGNITVSSITWSSTSRYVVIKNNATGRLKAEDSDGNTAVLPIQCDPQNPDKDPASWTNCHIVKRAGVLKGD